MVTLLYLKQLKWFLKIEGLKLYASFEKWLISAEKQTLFSAQLREPQLSGKCISVFSGVTGLFYVSSCWYNFLDYSLMTVEWLSW